MNLKQKQKQKQTKPTTRTGSESQKWRSHGGLSAAVARVGKNGRKVQGIKSINGRHKIDINRYKMGG